MATPENPELVPGGLDVSKLTDNAAEVISATADRFTDVIQQLLQHLSWENVILQLIAVLVSAGLGFWLSRRVNRLVDKWTPELGAKGMAAYGRRFVVALHITCRLVCWLAPSLRWLFMSSLRRPIIRHSRW